MVRLGLPVTREQRGHRAARSAGEPVRQDRPGPTHRDRAYGPQGDTGRTGPTVNTGDTGADSTVTGPTGPTGRPERTAPSRVRQVRPEPTRPSQVRQVRRVRLGPRYSRQHRGNHPGTSTTLAVSPDGRAGSTAGPRAWSGGGGCRHDRSVADGKTSL